jgi:hypothetical protein
MNLTLKLEMLNQRIDDYCKYERNSPNFERHLGELILQRQNLKDKLQANKNRKMYEESCIQSK